MKPKLKHALGLVLLVVVTGLVWWRFRPAAETPPPVVSAPATIKFTPAPDAPIVPPKPSQVAPPVAKSAPVAPSIQASAPTAPNTDSPDPRLALATALPDFARLVDSGDYVGATEKYLQLSPDISPEEFVAALQQSPDFPQLVRMAVNTMHAAQEISPTFDPAGNVATYSLPAPVDGKSIVRWKKIDDHWLLDAIDD